MQIPRHILLVLLGAAAWALPAAPARAGNGPQELAKLTSGTQQSFAFFGSSVALDGERALVGAHGEGPAGVAHLFERQGGVWIERARLLPPDPSSNMGFGAAVALLGDRLAVAAPWFDGPDKDTGVVYVYREVSAVWGLEGRLFAPNPGYEDRFGLSLALHGSALAAGTPFKDDAGTDAGAVFVYRRDGTSWTLENTLVAQDAHTRTLMGITLDLFGDRVVVGAVDDMMTPTPSSGAVYVFERRGGPWSQTAKLLGANSGDAFGDCVSLSGDWLLAGAPGRDTAGESGGSGYVFRHDGSGWVAETELVPASAASLDYHGMTVDTDGKTFLVGSWLARVGGVKTGSAFAFQKEGGTWVERGLVLGSDTEADDGFARSLCVDGERILAGASADDDLGTNAGAAYVFLLAEPPTVYCTAKTNSLGCVPSLSSTGSPSAGAGAGFVVSCSQVRNQKTGQFFYGLSGRLAAPFHGGTLCVDPPIKRTIGVTSGGTPKPANDCTGVYAIDFNAFATTGGVFPPAPELRIPGTRVYLQCWGRDQGFPPPDNHSFSDALEFTVGL